MSKKSKIHKNKEIFISIKNIFFSFDDINTRLFNFYY